MDQNTYKKELAKEAEIWGKLWTDEERSNIIKEDGEAANTLGLNKDAISFKGYIRDSGLKLQNGLSLACGEGRAEREFIKQGICNKFHAIDISEDAIIKARKLATLNNLDIEYECADLNEVLLEEAKYDFVLTQSCLHHVIDLEHLASQIHGSLRPQGVLWVHDYIGESKFQYSDKRLRIVNEIFEALPPELRYHRIRKMVIEKVLRPDPEKIISPFEAIRSEEIMDVFLKYFNIVEKHESHAISHLVMQTGMRKNYLDFDNGNYIYNLIHIIDRLLIVHGVLPPAGGQYILTPKNSKQ